MPSVSTFSWLAAWLSEARRIVLPVSGLFHPVQSPDIDLLPLADPRYSFVLFPINYSVPVAQYRAAHAALGGLWRQMRPEAIAALRDGPRWPRRLETAAAMLDEAFYMQTYPDVAKAVAEGGLTAMEHYCNHGFAEGRRAFAFDRNWYSTAYPARRLRGRARRLRRSRAALCRDRPRPRLPADALTAPGRSIGCRRCSLSFS